MEVHRPSSTRREKKLALLQDVDRLKKKLRHEENVHRALERAFTRPLGTLPRLPPYLPPYTLELLAEVAVLEEEVVRLEEQLVHFRKGLYLEAVNISTSKKSIENTDNSNHLCLVKSIGKVESVQAETNCVNTSNPQTDDRREKEQKEHQTGISSIRNKSNSPKQKPIMVRTSTMMLPFEMKKSEKGLVVKKVQLHCRYDSQDNVEASSPSLLRDERDLGDESPNEIAENILSCLLSIFSRMATSKNRLSTENLPACVPSPFVEEGCIELEDPYDVWPRFGKRDIGPYKYLCLVDARSINANRTSKSLFSVRRLRILAKKLASVKLQSHTHQEKHAFWINVYNSCMMNVYLERGIPENLEKVVELMQKATINVWGHMLNAITIEHFILRLPYHSKYTFQKDVKKVK